MNNRELRDAKSKYKAQKSNSLNQRNIGWEFDFNGWLQLWLDSGHWYERGNRRGCYVMARFNDTGPYSPSNVKIITGSENSKEAIDRSKLKYNKVQSILKSIRHK